MPNPSHAHEVMALLDGRRSGAVVDPDVGVRASWLRSVVEHGLEPDRVVEADVLTHAELVERRADPKDRRAWRLHLTAKGRTKIKELEPTASAMFVDALQGISEAKQAELEDMLNLIRSNLTRKPMEAANG